nr:hypothetical protein CFP56_63530 [Quercus suber]
MLPGAKRHVIFAMMVMCLHTLSTYAVMSRLYMWEKELLQISLCQTKRKSHVLLWDLKSLDNTDMMSNSPEKAKPRRQRKSDTIKQRSRAVSPRNTPSTATDQLPLPTYNQFTAAGSRETFSDMPLTEYHDILNDDLFTGVETWTPGDIFLDGTFSKPSFEENSLRSSAFGGGTTIDPTSLVQSQIKPITTPETAANFEGPSVIAPASTFTLSSIATPASNITPASTFEKTEISEPLSMLESVATFEPASTFEFASDIKPASIAKLVFGDNTMSTIDSHTLDQFVLNSVAATAPISTMSTFTSGDGSGNNSDIFTQCLRKNATAPGLPEPLDVSAYFAAQELIDGIEILVKASMNSLSEAQLVMLMTKWAAAYEHGVHEFSL